MSQNLLHLLIFVFFILEIICRYIFIYAYYDDITYHITSDTNSLIIRLICILLTYKISRVSPIDDVKIMVCLRKYSSVRDSFRLNSIYY